jgi:hypothetical protein
VDVVTAWRGLVLDLLLAFLVVGSLLLSSRVWTDPTRYEVARTEQPRVQPQPYAPTWTMPDIYRPVRIMVTLPDGQGTWSGPDSETYSRIWRAAKPLLQGLRPIGLPTVVGEGDLDAWRQGPVITLVLPLAMPLAEWADRWEWNAFGLRTESGHRVDRVVLFAGNPGGILFEGPEARLRMSHLFEPDLTELAGLVATIPVSDWRPHSALPDDKVDRLLHSPDIGHVALPRAIPVYPDRTAVLSRFFPDLSVVRQIDEKELKGADLGLTATSYTDGQKLVRIYDYGAIEYYAPDRAAGSLPPSFVQALNLAQNFVTAHGGWPQNVALTGWETVGNRVILTFDLHQGASNLPPVMTRHGFLRVTATADRVVHLFRDPAVQVDITGPNRPVISVREALRILSEERPWTRFEKVRDAALVYLLHEGPGRNALEPVWVISLTWGRPFYVRALAVPADGGGRLLSDVPRRP